MRSLRDSAVEIVRALNQAGLRYAVGGAIAIPFYGAPARTTIDIDISVLADYDQLDAAFRPLFYQRLGNGGYRDPTTGFDADCYLVDSELKNEMLRRRRSYWFDGERIWILEVTDWAALKVAEAKKGPRASTLKHFADILSVSSYALIDERRWRSEVEQLDATAMLKELGPLNHP